MWFLEGLFVFYIYSVFSRERRCGVNLEIKSFGVIKVGFYEDLNRRLFERDR